MVPPRLIVGTGLLLTIAACSDPPRVSGTAAPVLCGLTDPQLDANQRGRVLLDELGCSNCHQDALADARSGPDLTRVGRRLHTAHLVTMVSDPLSTEPGTTMPDALRHLDNATHATAVQALTAYLHSFPADAAAAATAAVPATDDADAQKRGRALYHVIGCVACHAARDAEGADTELPGFLPLGDVAAKYPPAELVEFLLAPHAARPAARMPDFGLSLPEAQDLARFLLGAATPPASATAPVATDAATVNLGRRLFAEHGCAHCHALPDASRPEASQPTPLRELNPDRGCLSPTNGPWPFYALTDQQRADLAAALRSLDEDRSDEDRITHRLLARNCLVCHERGERGGIQPERNGYFLSHDPSIGRESREPPPLTGVGAKLQPEWLTNSIAYGQHERPYVRTRMPGFGAALAAELTPLFASVDTLPPLEITPLPDDNKQRRAVFDLGQQLVGDKGMNCISCHTFAGEQAGAMGALDLVASTGQRLQPRWFAHFLRDPFAFKPGTLMTQFFPDGVSIRPEFGDGDVERQIAAIWHYLERGRNVRKPRGLLRPPLELVVHAEAVLLRRSVQNTGKRGISVGYPGGVNITFDAERLGLNQIWWGRFIDAGGVWRNQGSGQARLLDKPTALPNGPAFAQLPDAAAPWPAASRRELGQRWLGYDLDPQQRPTFRYTCGDVEISDTLHELRDEQAGAATALHRKLLFTGEGDTTLHFRAALDADIEALPDGAFRIGDRLHLQAPPEAARIRAAGDARELLIAVPLTAGEATLVLIYTRYQEGK